MPKPDLSYGRTGSFSILEECSGFFERRGQGGRQPAAAPFLIPGTDSDTILDLGQTPLEATPNNCGCIKAAVELWRCLSPLTMTFN